MLGSCKDVESAEVPKLLEEIAIEIYNRGKANDFVNISSSDGMKWLNENCSTADRLVKAFLIKHGHRALKEYDLVAITWGMKPDQVIEMIQTTVKGILSNRKDMTMKKKVLSDRDIISGLKTPKKWSTRQVKVFSLKKFAENPIHIHIQIHAIKTHPTLSTSSSAPRNIEKCNDCIHS